jgi:hypothetical protein
MTHEILFVSQQLKTWKLWETLGLRPENLRQTEGVLTVSSSQII